MKKLPAKVLAELLSALNLGPTDLSGVDHLGMMLLSDMPDETLLLQVSDRHSRDGAVHLQTLADD
eukprot:CAMPEP_0195002058 /NCGR_PEP_ID=MMETSP0326_2-20130528/2150_1 /TAXON_ID=2866 ORGANISM="Crypthecodinium cohnii, Strain Seligo" /NCGR_SAMPLE_ID=MMETSP0326_2 /ASSEMBLY_ACC=CAM_ASM_000348 /LENGTH=64 /DNA_ID=CAMNT_0040005273 /DNA_START=25 /DNA_END=220 /DNA_ORIENTATION=+